MNSATSHILTHERKRELACLVLAGGRASRLQGVDKGMLRWRGLPLAEHVLRRVAPQVSGFGISCNRNHEHYLALAKKYGLSTRDAALPNLIEDIALPAYSGPLAGIFSCLEDLKVSAHKAPRYLFVCCCDTPMLPGDIAARLLNHMRNTSSEACYPLLDNNHMRLILMLDIAAATRAMLSWQTAKAMTFRCAAG